MMKALPAALVFDGTHNIRMAYEDGEPLWCAKDVCDAVGLTNSRQTIGRLDCDEKANVISNDATGRPHKITFLNESGLYKLLMTTRLRKEDESRMGKIKQFQRWVTHEVLPSIRKTGAYSVQAEETDSVLLLLESIKHIRTDQIAFENRLTQVEQKMEAKPPPLPELPPLNSFSPQRREIRALCTEAVKRTGEFRGKVMVRAYHALEVQHRISLAEKRRLLGLDFKIEAVEHLGLLDDLKHILRHIQKERRSA